MVEQQGTLSKMEKKKTARRMLQSTHDERKQISVYIIVSPVTEFQDLKNNWELLCDKMNEPQVGI